MVRVRNFHENLEKGLEKLTADIKERVAAEPKEEKLPEREILKKAIQSITSFAEPASVSSPQSDNSSLPSYLQVGSPQVKAEVEKLVNLVWSDGLEKAVREAKKYPPFIEDAFHDALTDKLLPELKKRGVFK